jgi:hypothetical protein
LWVLGLAASFIVAAIDAALGHQAVLIGLLIIGPCCVSLTGRWVLTGLTGLWVIGLAVTPGLPDDIWGSAIFFTWLVVLSTTSSHRAHAGTAHADLAGDCWPRPLPIYRITI